MSPETSEQIAAEPPREPAPLDLDALISELDAGEYRLPEAALRQCQSHAELVTPRLVATLEEAVRLGHEGKVRPGNAHFFALFLLTEFRAAESLPIILEMMSLPERVIDRLAGGDTITECFPRILAVLGANHPDLIEAMIPSRDLGEYVRWAAAGALRRMVVDKTLERADALARLTRQFREAVAAGDHWGATVTVNELAYLNPLEIQDEVEQAFEQELVNEEFLDCEYFCELLDPQQPGECPELAGERPSYIEDTVEELRPWDCFRERPVEPLFARGDRFKPDFELVDSDEESLEEVAEDDNEVPASYESLTIRREEQRVGRNDPCPCGSGKKYKKCCLKSGGTL